VTSFSLIPFIFKDDSTLSSVEELENAIEHVKSLVLETEAISADRQKLVRRLIELRLKLEDVKEVTEDLVPSADELRIVQSHQFLLQKQLLRHHLSAQYCDRCGGVIWTVLQSHYRCKGNTFFTNFLIRSFKFPFAISKVLTPGMEFSDFLGCYYQCHSKCLNEVVRHCQFLKVSVESQYIRNICPEKGLPSQNYKCAECKGHFTLSKSISTYI
jgi:hypothetical protein